MKSYHNDIGRYVHDVMRPCQILLVWAFEKRDYKFIQMHARSQSISSSALHPYALCIPQQQKNKCIRDRHTRASLFSTSIPASSIKRLMACQTKRSQIGLIWSQLLFGSAFSIYALLIETITINNPLSPCTSVHLSNIYSIRLRKQCQEFFHIAPGQPFNIIIVAARAEWLLGLR